MSIRTRILALVGSFAVMALIVTALGLMTIGDYNAMLARFDHAYHNAWRGERLNHLVSNVVMESRGIYGAHDTGEAQTFAANLNRNLDDMEQLLTEWQGDATPDEAVRLKPLVSDASQFIALRRKVAQLGAAGASEQAEQLGLSNRQTRIAFQDKVETMVTTTRAQLATARTAVDGYTRRRAASFFVTALIGIGVMLALALWIISQTITRPLRELAMAIVKTSKGEHDIPLPQPRGTDEISEVWRAVAVLRDRGIEHELLATAQREAERQAEMKLREILLD